MPNQDPESNRRSRPPESSTEVNASASGEIPASQETWKKMIAGVTLVEFLPLIDPKRGRNDRLIGLAREYAYSSVETTPAHAEKLVIMPLYAALHVAGYQKIADALKERAYSQLEGLELQTAMADRFVETPFAFKKFGTLESALANTGEQLLYSGFPTQSIPLLTLSLTIYHFQHYRGVNVTSLMVNDLKNLGYAFSALGGLDNQERASEFLYRAMCLDGRGLPTIP